MYNHARLKIRDQNEVYRNYALSLVNVAGKNSMKMAFCKQLLCFLIALHCCSVPHVSGQGESLTLLVFVAIVVQLSYGLQTRYKCKTSYNYTKVSNLYVVAQISTITFHRLSPPFAETPVFTLRCTSTGGPVASLTWSRDDIPLTNTGPLVLDDRKTSTYHNVLEVTGRVPGFYSCQIRDNSGSIIHAMNYNVKGMFHTYIFNGHE